LEVKDPFTYREGYSSEVTIYFVPYNAIEMTILPLSLPNECDKKKEKNLHSFPWEGN